MVPLVVTTWAPKSWFGSPTHLLLERQMGTLSTKSRFPSYYNSRTPLPCTWPEKVDIGQLCWTISLFSITQQVPHLCMSWSVKLWSTWGPNRELGSDPSAPPMPVTAVAASCVLGRGLSTSGDIVQQTWLINASSVDVQGRSRYIAFRQAVQPVQMFVPFVPSF